MEAPKLSQASALLRFALSTACLGAAAWGLYVFSVYHDTVYWNLCANSHAYSYVHPAIYGLTLVAALRGVSVAVGSWRSPGTASGRAMNIGLAVLLALTLWAGAATLLARAYTA